MCSLQQQAQFFFLNLILKWVLLLAEVRDHLQPYKACNLHHLVLDWYLQFWKIYSFPPKKSLVLFLKKMFTLIQNPF